MHWLGNNVPLKLYTTCRETRKESNIFVELIWNFLNIFLTLYRLSRNSTFSFVGSRVSGHPVWKWLLHEGVQLIYKLFWTALAKFIPVIVFFKIGKKVFELLLRLKKNVRWINENLHALFSAMYKLRSKIIQDSGRQSFIPNFLFFMSSFSKVINFWVKWLDWYYF